VDEQGMLVDEYVPLPVGPNLVVGPHAVEDEDENGFHLGDQAESDESDESDEDPEDHGDFEVLRRIP
jgi:hypothetical protein